MITLNQQQTHPSHGSDLHRALCKYGIEESAWLDLSSGVSPWSWPVQSLPNEIWNKLPPPNTELIKAASEYYQIEERQVTPTPGSQMAIRLIPLMVPHSSVAIPTLGYQEHAASWRNAKHRIVYYSSIEELLLLIDQRSVEHAVVINPNNPSTELVVATQISEISKNLNGLFILDEAFMDIFDKTYESSVTDRAKDKVIVLRSLGKFFGLAGLRVGFALGDHSILAQLNDLLQPWSISHASQRIATQALRDTDWQSKQRTRIFQQSTLSKHALSEYLPKLLSHYELKQAGLFSTIFAEAEELHSLHHHLANNAIWTRLFNQGDQPTWLRLSLPFNQTELIKRLAQA